jgi:hypothetical protein
MKILEKDIDILLAGLAEDLRAKGDFPLGLKGESNKR